MVKKLHSKKMQKKIWIILAILIVPAFVLWGSGSLIRSKQEAVYVGKILGKKITFLEYKDALGAVRNLMIMRYGDNYSEIQKANLESQAWERLILLAEAKNRKIKVSDKEVIEAIESYPFFQRNGQFDNKIYSSMLQYEFRTQPRIFEEQTRQNLAIVNLAKKITNNVNLTEKEIKEEYRKLNEEISLDYISSLPQDFTKESTVSDKEIKDYYLKESLQFKQPLSFNIEYISLTEDAKGKEPIETKVRKIFLRLKKKEDFVKVAKDFGLSLKETGLFAENGPIPGIGWAPEITNLIAKNNPGQYLSPIQLDRNYYILKVKERKEPYVPTLEAIKDKVKEGFIKDKSKEIARQSLENCFKKLKDLYRVNPKSVNFESTAKLFGLKSGSTGLFKYGSYIEGIGASDNFWTIAQSLKDAEFSDVIDTPLGFYIIKLKSRLPIDEKKFAAEKTAFNQLLLLQKKQENFSRFIEELKKGTQRF